MTRKDLESKVQVRWEPIGERSRRCVGELSLASDCCVDMAVASLSGGSPEDLVGWVEKEVRRRVVESVLGDLETENRGLRAALEKWGRRAMAGSASRQLVAGTWETELKEDLE